MNNIILAICVVGGIGLIFGLLLAFSSHIFKVEVDERVEKISEILPGANCGSCGYAGCAAFADAVVKGTAPVNGCTVGKAPVAEKVAGIMGVEAGEVAEVVARVMCTGDRASVVYKYEYRGIDDCKAAAKFGGGSQGCQSGCVGLGRCAKVCQFGAIEVKDGVAVVDDEKCQACGKCIKECPKNLIRLVPKKQRHWVVCSNPETGKFVNQYCKNGCIGCHICEKECKFDAIHVENNHAVIDYDKCKNCGLCAKKCPRGVIVSKPRPGAKPKVTVETAPVPEKTEA